MKKNVWQMPKSSPYLQRSFSVIEARNLSENTRVEQTHDGSGQPDECNRSSAHMVKEQFAPEENRDIALFQHEQRLQSCNQRGGH